MNIVIVGGGTAGWITSLFLLSEYKNINITVIESDVIGILGAGEGSTPLMRKFLKKCNIDENDFIKKTKSTFKLGIDFENWNIHNTLYKHPFINNAKAYHFDARLIAEYFKEISINRGVTHINGIIKTFIQNDKKDITKLILEDDTIIESDFLFDCSGFHRLLIGKLYNSNWISYSNHLKVNTAVPFFLDRNDTNMELDTKAIAMDYGWMWQIPLQHRWGCGYVFDGNIINEIQAKEEIELKLNRKIQSPKTLKFSAGYYDNVWVNNCIAMGLASGFLEPLEAVSIHITLMELNLIKNHLFKDKDTNVVNEKFSQIMDEHFLFIYYHYLCNKKDTQFWSDYNLEAAPSELHDFVKKDLNISFSSDEDYISKFKYNDVVQYTHYDWKLINDGIFGLNKSVL